jgi:hypothetical protein
MLISVAPAGLEKMFFEFGVPLAEGATTALPPTKAEIEKLLLIAPRYGIEITLPGEDVIQRDKRGDNPGPPPPAFFFLTGNGTGVPKGVKHKVAINSMTKILAHAAYDVRCLASVANQEYHVVRSSPTRGVEHALYLSSCHRPLVSTGIRTRETNRRSDTEGTKTHRNGWHLERLGWRIRHAGPHWSP